MSEAAVKLSKEQEIKNQLAKIGGNAVANEDGDIVASVTTNGKGEIVVTFPSTVHVAQLDMGAQNTVGFNVRVPDFYINLTNDEGGDVQYRVRGGKRTFNLAKR